MANLPERPVTVSPKPNLVVEGLFFPSFCVEPVMRNEAIETYGRMALLLEALPNRPELAESILAWRPLRKSAASVEVGELDRLIEAAQDAVREAMRSDEPVWFEIIARTARREIRPQLRGADTCPPRADHDGG